EFIFAFPAYNVRSTELNAVLGRTQLKRLDQNNERRTANLKLFLEGLDPKKYRTDFAVEGSCNYAFTLVLNKPDDNLMAAVEKKRADHGHRRLGRELPCRVHRRAPSRSEGARLCALA